MLGFPKLWKELLRLDINYIYFEDCNDQVKGRGSQMDGKKTSIQPPFWRMVKSNSQAWCRFNTPDLPPLQDYVLHHLQLQVGNTCAMGRQVPRSHMDILSLAVTKWCWQHWHNHVQPSPHVHNDTMCFWIFSPTTAGCARVCGIVGPRSHAPYIGSNMFPWLHMHNNNLHELSITSGLPMCFWIFSPTTAGCARVCGIVGHRSHALQGMVD